MLSDKLRAHSDELASHIGAFGSRDAALIVLTRRQQDSMMELLLNPPEPNEALRRAFGKG